MTTVLLIHAAATWAMLGLIWFVQLVHYPLFANVGTTSFRTYEERHTVRTAVVVAGFMPVEALTAAWLVIDTPTGVSAALATLGLILVAALWLSTAAWQAPLHGKLSLGYDPAVQRRLVTSNWIRTALWTARGVLVLIMVARTMS